MEFSQLLSLQIIAHLLSDFYFQTKEQAKDKNNLGFKSSFLKWHFLITLVFSWMLSFQINFIFAALIISLSHYTIDGLKRHLKNHPRLGKTLFFTDQILHLLILISVVFLFDKYFEIKPLFPIQIELKHLALFTGYLICLKPANILIKQVFIAFTLTNTEDKERPNTGKLIGLAERFLVLTFVLLNQYEAIGLLLIAKSIIRYKEYGTFRLEHLLIGTLLSFGIALFTGVMITLI